jgi:hypothetical protein
MRGVDSVIKWLNSQRYICDIVPRHTECLSASEMKVVRFRSDANGYVLCGIGSGKGELQVATSTFMKLLFAFAYLTFKFTFRSVCEHGSRD